MIVSNYKIKNFKVLTKGKTYNWLITGVAGFIGSNLLFKLLELDQKVIGIDNFSTGKKKNLDFIKKNISKNKWRKFKFIKQDLNHYNVLKLKKYNIDFVLHQAARGSVIRSIKDPISTNDDNVSVFLKILNAARIFKVKNFVYASSSSVYGDSKKLPKKESHKGNILSNYALTKNINEMYAEVFFRQYNFKSVGLRYFNVFGMFQNPEGEYAAVIPRWINSVIKKKNVIIFGDGKTSRDFCPVQNVVQANILASLKPLKANNYVFNVANGQQTTLNYLIKMIYNYFRIKPKKQKIFYKDFRKGDIRHSLASIDKIKKYLKYKPTINFEQGLDITIKWFLK